MRELGWGLHRLGNLSARYPWTALAFVVAMSALAVFGIWRMEPASHSLDALFEADTPEYRRYAEMRAAFPLNERDLIVVASSDKPFTGGDIGTLRDLHLEFQLLDEVDSVLSLFSIRGDPDPDGYAPPLVPDELPEGKAFDDLMAETAAHPFVAAKLLNPTPGGGQALVILVGMKADAVNRVNLIPTIDTLIHSADSVLGGSGLRYEVFGVPLAQRDVRLASRSDRLTFNVAGFLIGLLIALALFRDFRLVFIATLCPVVANLWSFGLFGLIDFPMSFFTNAIPPLVLVISFAEAMHLTYGIRRHLREGGTLAHSVRETIAVVGPGCVLTTLTTATAFFSLVITDSATVREFGLAGAISIGLIFIASMTVVPSLAMLMLKGSSGASGVRFLAWAGDPGLDRMSSSLARWAPRYPILVAVAGTLICVACGALYFDLEPRFRLSEQFPDRLQERIENVEKYAGLAASSPLYVVVRYPEHEAATSERLQRVIGEVDDRLAHQALVGNVWSLAVVERQLADSDPGALRRYLDELPDHLRARLMNESARALLVTGHLPDLEAKEMRRVIADVEADLAPLRSANPDLTIEVTGIAAVAAVDATAMIQGLNDNLTWEILIVMGLLALAFRSLTVPLIAFLPNVFPIVASGALLYVLGLGIDYAGIIGLSIAFGLACDDTVHFIARFQHEKRKAGSDLPGAVTATVEHMGPVMIVTTLVIMFGVSVTLLGQMPQTRLFGAVVVVTLFSALLAELVLTPALILVPHALRRIWRVARVEP